MFEKPGLKKVINRLRNADGITLLCIVMAAVAYSIAQRTMLDFRAGHMDEYDYLFVGKTFLSGLKWPTYTYIFGANFSWYLFGIAEQWLGGLTGARVLAAVCGLVSLAGVYLLAMALWSSRPIALCATLLMGVHSGHIFQSKLATYDSVSFALFVPALALLVRGVNIEKPSLSVRRQFTLVTAGSLLLVFAVLAKYTTAAYLPLVALTLLLFSVKATMLFCIIVGAGLATHFLLHWQDLMVLYEVQINGVHRANASYAEILFRVLNHTWLLLLPSLIALIYVRPGSAEIERRSFYIISGLLIFSLPLVLYHVHGRNLISLYKHMNYANLFLSLAAAWLAIKVANAKPWTASHFFRYRLRILATFLAAYVVVNINALHDIQRGYPDVTELLHYLGSETLEGPIISEDPYLFRYLEFGQMSQDNIKETSWLDNNRDGRHTSQDVKDAIWDRKFNTVLLTDAIHPEDNQVLRKIMTQRGYTLEFNHEYALSPIMTTHTVGQISLYRLEQQTISNAEP